MFETSKMHPAHEYSSQNFRLTVVVGDPHDPSWPAFLEGDPALLDRFNRHYCVPIRAKLTAAFGGDKERIARLTEKVLAGALAEIRANSVGIDGKRIPSLVLDLCRRVIALEKERNPTSPIS